jgi:hypothetical protein
MGMDKLGSGIVVRLKEKDAAAGWWQREEIGERHNFPSEMQMQDNMYCKVPTCK